MRELTLREKQAIWMLTEKKKSIGALAKTKSMENQEFGNHQRPTTTWSAEKTTVVDDRQNINAVKMNPKRHVCKISNNFQKAGWCSDNLLSSGDFDTELQTLHREMQTSDQHHKQKGKTGICKKAQRVRSVLELCLWADETKMKLYISDGKAKVWRKKGTANDPKPRASSVKHGGGVVMAWHACCLWNRPSHLHWWINVWWQ